MQSCMDMPYMSMISIHALREESDLWYCSHSQSYRLFQSTLSVRRATGKTFAAKRYGIKISIHALREESDSVPSSQDYGGAANFNPRSP